MAFASYCFCDFKRGRIHCIVYAGIYVALSINSGLKLVFLKLNLNEDTCNHRHTLDARAVHSRTTQPTKVSHECNFKFSGSCSKKSKWKEVKLVLIVHFV